MDCDDYQLEPLQPSVPVHVRLTVPVLASLVIVNVLFAPPVCAFEVAVDRVAQVVAPELTWTWPAPAPQARPVGLT